MLSCAPNPKDEAAVAKYLEEKRLAEEEAARLAEEEKRIERENNPTDNDLLRQIVKLLEEDKNI